jgi:hypothetical protein
MTGASEVRSAGVRTLALGLAVMVTALILLVSARPAEAAPNVFTVDRDDDPDLSTTPVADNCADAIAADCSLRGAITKANRTTNDAAGPDEIRFNIPGAGPHTISPTSSLPSITGTVSIDGYTQPGANERTSTNNAVLKIELSGASAGQLVNGLILDTGAGGTKIRGLVINRFGGTGVVIDAQSTVIAGNFIGTNPAGDADLGNGIAGVGIRSSGNLIGGTSTGARNVISGNGGDGVVINGFDASNNRIEGNRIGTDANGTSGLGNGQGVNITSTSGNFVGGPEVGAANLIAGNTSRGVLLAGDAADNKVQGNFIGTNGTADLGNGTEGVEIFEGSNNVIGGTESRTGNIISGNGTDGVKLNRAASNNMVQGNLIGTSQSGASDLGNGEVGVLVLGPNNVVGGTVGGARNVISGNGGVGVSMLGTSASGNAVQGNRIGTQVDGTTPLGNFHGVFISEASRNKIGGSVSAAANTISGNLNHGVIIVGTNATGNRVLRNSIFNNGTPGGLGIELNNDGVTLNDNKDPDTGPNKLQNFPVITSASATKITGKLNSRPGKSFTVQFFSNPQPNFPTGFGEGQTFLGQKTVRTNDRGKVSFAFTTTLSADQVITATATDSAGNTSEFSQGVFVG